MTYLIRILRSSFQPYLMSCRMWCFALRLLLAVVLSFACSDHACAQLSGVDLSPINNSTPFPVGLPPKPVRLQQKREPTLADIFPRKDDYAVAPQPITLGNVKIPGLTEKTVRTLGFNYFVVVNNTGFDTISSLYRANRLAGKCNFVTVDSILHPYFGFRNALLGASIEQYLYDDMRALLHAMVQSSIKDFRETEDEEVKDDIQRNLAFLNVGLKILAPAKPLPDIGGADLLVEHDYRELIAAGHSSSKIFNQSQDFSSFRPWGFLASTEKLRRFSMCYQWLSRMRFPLRNVTDNSVTGGGNSFRRAVLLNRSLMLAIVDGSPAIVRWHRIARGFSMVGPDSYANLNAILPEDMAPVLNSSKRDFKRLLRTLSQPFSRAKLLLSVRKQRPVSLGATSIFEIGRGQNEERETYRLFPLVQPPELRWLRPVARQYKQEAMAPTPTPLALLTLHAHGAQGATNLLSMQLETLDERLVKSVPYLERIVNLPRGGKNKEEIDPRWKIASLLFRGYPDNAQMALRSPLWSHRQLETAISVWLDSYLAYCPLEKPGNRSGSSPAEPGNPQNRARFHYLEPRPLLFNMMSVDCQYLTAELKKLQIFPAEYEKRSGDFVRLLERFQSISKRELQGRPITKPDFHLLANIDQVLSPVDSPLPGTVFLNSLSRKTGADVSAGEGASLGLGKAGKLYIICSTTQGATLCRGGVYTYYEVAGGPIAKRHWLRKLRYSLLRPPIWASQFDFVQAGRTPARQAQAPR